MSKSTFIDFRAVKREVTMVQVLEHYGLMSRMPPEAAPTASVNTRKARLYYLDGRIEHYNDQKLAFAVWLALPKGVRAPFRGANDNRPLYPWSYVDV